MVQRTSNTITDAAFTDVFDAAVHGELGGAHLLTVLDGDALVRIEGDSVYWPQTAYAAGPPIEGAAELTQGTTVVVQTGRSDRISKIRVRAVAGGTCRVSLLPMRSGRSG